MLTALVKTHRLRAMGVLWAAVIAAPLAHAQTYTVLHDFTTADGANPQAGLTMDPAGNLYGTTYNGGTYNYGAVFKLDSTGTETVLCSFTGGTDGANPAASVTRDSAGNLYGTTVRGGTLGYGVVFKLDSPARKLCSTALRAETMGRTPTQP
jgi:uncharacterized repeat protein (TIGR03803 family)